jgi:hypothetical protein
VHTGAPCTSLPCLRAPTSPHLTLLCCAALCCCPPTQPANTQEAGQLLDIFAQLRAEGRRQLTVLLLGKSGVGKSSTVNSLLGEKAAAVSAFKLQPDTESSSTYARQVCARVGLVSCRVCVHGMAVGPYCRSGRGGG